MNQFAFLPYVWVIFCLSKKNTRMSVVTLPSRNRPENEMRELIFVPLFFVPHEWPGRHDGSKRKINTCVLPYIQGPRRKTRTNKPVYLQLNEVGFDSKSTILELKRMRRLCVIPECWHKATESTGFYHRANLKSICEKEGNKKPSGKKMKTSCSTSEWLSRIFT